MKITKTNISVREITNGYTENAQDNGVYAYEGKLCCRPAYQREFRYSDKQQKAVIDTIRKGFPLNVMYWSKSENGTYELIDGQQRTLSICEYVCGNFSYENKYFHNLTSEEQERILNYELDIYICEGEESEKLEWFSVINIAGEKLTNQELLNATYMGSWLSDAKVYFSKTNCVAYKRGSSYFNGSPIKQELLEKAIAMMSAYENNGKANIADYMAKHQHDKDASEMWLHFKKVCDWIEGLFPKYRKEMKSVEWGELYRLYGNNHYSPTELEKEVAKLMQDSDVTSKKGIYAYVLSRNEKYLNIRSFDDNMKRESYERQNGICPICGEYHNISEMEAHHKKMWSQGGHTNSDNCIMLCKKCHDYVHNKAFEIVQTEQCVFCNN